MNTAISDSVIDTMVKPISPAPLSAASIGLHAFLEMADDVLDHHDGVVDHEADRDRERHERQVVEAVIQLIQHREGADEGKRNGDRRYDGRPEVAQENENHHHHERRSSAST